MTPSWFSAAILDIILPTIFSIKYEYKAVYRAEKCFGLVDFGRFFENPPSWTVPPFLNIFQIAFLRNFSTVEYYKT
jgi:hypothetical protein